MDHSETMARARTKSIPDGVYEAESYMDDDGIEIGKKVPIKVRVTVKGEEMTVDLTDVARQVRGSFNSGITTGYACSQVAYKCLTSPTDYPINDGSFRSLKAIVPPGRVVSAVRPAPMRWWMTYPMTIVDTVFKALAPVIPDRVIAGHHADLVIAATHGINTKTSEFFLANFGPLGGGWGAKRSEDGVSATVCINDGDTHNSPSEQSEVKFPLVVERYALIADSGGAGRYRGGLGLERVVRARVPMTFNSHVERAHCKPWGLEGGGEATGNEVAVRTGSKWKTDFPNAKVLVAYLRARRRLPHALWRRRRPRLAARPADRRGRGRCPAGLHLGGGGQGPLWRRARPGDFRCRCGGNRTAAGLDATRPFAFGCLSGRCQIRLLAAIRQSAPHKTPSRRFLKPWLCSAILTQAGRGIPFGLGAPQGPRQSRLHKDFETMSRVSSLSSPFLLGFDEIERVLDRVGKAADGYPPYNIERIARDGNSPERLRITLAVAGFTRDQLDVSIEESQLVIRGRQHDDKAKQYIHRGIAARQFQRIFVLADGMEVLGADLKNGLLSIDLARPQPERLVKSIAINECD